MEGLRLTQTAAWSPFLHYRLIKRPSVNLNRLFLLFPQTNGDSGGIFCLQAKNICFSGVEIEHITLTFYKATLFVLHSKLDSALIRMAGSQSSCNFTNAVWGERVLKVMCPPLCSCWHFWRKCEWIGQWYHKYEKETTHLTTKLKHSCVFLDVLHQYDHLKSHGN